MYEEDHQTKLYSSRPLCVKVLTIWFNIFSSNKQNRLTTCIWSSTETRSICSIALEKEAPKQKDRKRRWKLWFLEVEVADHQRRGCSSLFRHWTSWLIFTIIPARYPGRVIKINHFQRSSHDPTAAIWIANQWEGVCASDALWFIILLHLFAFWHLPMGMLLFGDWWSWWSKDALLFDHNWWDWQLLMREKKIFLSINYSIRIKLQWLIRFMWEFDSISILTSFNPLDIGRWESVISCFYREITPAHRKCDDPLKVGKLTPPPAIRL